MRQFILLVLSAAWAAAADAPRVEIRTSRGTIVCRLYADECPETVRSFTELAEGRKAWTDPATGQPVQRPFYDGLTFHRVIPGFMIQGGCPLGTGTGGPGFQFKDEINAVSLGLDKELVVQGDRMNPLCAYQMQQFMALFFEPRFTARKATTPEQRQAALPAVLDDLKATTVLQFYQALGYAYDPALPPSHRPVKGSLAMANSGPATNGSQFFINLGDTPHLTGKHTVFGEVESGMDVAIAIGAVPRGAGDKPTTPVTITAIRPVGSTVPVPWVAPAPAVPAPSASAAPAR